MERWTFLIIADTGGAPIQIRILLRTGDDEIAWPRAQPRSTARRCRSTRSSTTTRPRNGRPCSSSTAAWSAAPRAGSSRSKMVCAPERGPEQAEMGASPRCDRRSPLELCVRD